MDNLIISTERLDLIAMTPEFLEASLAGETGRAERLLGLTIPDEWFEARRLMQMRLDQLRRDPALLPWLARAIALRRERVVVGRIGFHSGPAPDYLRDLSPGGVELGYAIFAPYRRQGFAREACRALMGWARQAHAVTRFVVSIRPDNAPSLRLAQQLGFVRIGSQVDEDDGPEDVFELRVEE